MFQRYQGLVRYCFPELSASSLSSCIPVEALVVVMRNIAEQRILPSSQANVCLRDEASSSVEQKQIQLCLRSITSIANIFKKHCEMIENMADGKLQLQNMEGMLYAWRERL
jgi:hypothetical protein